MANTRSITRKRNIDGSALWSNLDFDLLLLILMRLGLFDFMSFSGVCTSWRSVAITNWNRFMLTKQPIYVSISSRLYNKEFYLEDDTGRRLKTNIPHSDGRSFVGISGGYLIFVGMKTCDFFLVNPFTRKELYFSGNPLGIIPGIRFGTTPNPKYIRAILVFSPSMSGWVCVVVIRNGISDRIAFSLAGKEAAWFYVSSPHSIRDLHFFKGKIYTLDRGDRLCELRLNPEPALTELKMNNFPWPQSHRRKLEFVSSGEHLYVMDVSGDEFETFEVDFGGREWVSSESAADIEPDPRAYPWTHYECLNYSDIDDESIEKVWFLCTNMWYFPHDCLIDNKTDMKNGDGALVNKLEE